MKTKELRVPRVDRFTDLLAGAVSNGCRHRLEIPLTVVALAVSLLGMPTPLHQPAWIFFAESPDSMESMRAMWKELVGYHDFLRNHMAPLLSWMGKATPQDVVAVQCTWKVLATVDMLAMAEQCGGDLLGPVYQLMMSSSTRKANGAFYTPMNVSKMIASMSDIREGVTVTDPCCGTGGMLVAAAQVMREKGRNPRRVHWVLNDIDPIAVALAGVNCAAHGMGPNVTLTANNALAPTAEQRGLVFKAS